MTTDEVLDKSKKLAARSQVVLLGSNGTDGYPNIKAMLVTEIDGLKKFWITTNKSAKRSTIIAHDPRSCLYFLDPQGFEGLMLVGEIVFHDDHATKQRMWRDGFDTYYPQGIDDPDYTVIEFTAKYANYYHGLQNYTFDV